MSPELLPQLSLLVLLLPLLGFVLMVFFGKKLPRQGDWLETGIITTALGLSLYILLQKLTVFHDEALRITATWVDLQNVPGFGPLKIVLGVQIDNLAAIMMAVVALISTLVHLFSIGYMQGDVRYSRYFAFLGLFSFSMLMIVLADNLFMLYVGWELVGISSYLLIGHWYEKKSASNAAMKAFIVNRVGDLGFFIGVAILFNTFKTFGLPEIFEGIRQGTLPAGSEGWMTAAGVLLFCGAIGKSAQFPLHVWLPDAMEGPTPVSALIHAATMVAAGVYLVARIFPLMTAQALLVVAYIGAITAFISATIAIAQNDIKKVLAYSTISQLGYMVMGLGVGAYTAGFFHLVTHAMFKAGLFLGSGSVIHAMHHALHHQGDHHTDPQDIRNMGGLKGKMPVTFWTFVIYTLAISGVPLTSGFLSKDAILAGTMAFAGLSGHVIIPIIGFLVAGLTAFYMFRVVILTFLGEHKDGHRLEHVHESPLVMTLPLMVLAALSLFVFFSFNPIDAKEGWLAEGDGAAGVGRPRGGGPDGPRAVRGGPAPRAHAGHAALPGGRRPRHPCRIPDLLVEADQRGPGRGIPRSRPPLPAQQVVLRRTLSGGGGARRARPDRDAPLVRQHHRRRRGQRERVGDQGGLVRERQVRHDRHRRDRQHDRVLCRAVGTGVPQAADRKGADVHRVRRVQRTGVLLRVQACLNPGSALKPFIA